MLLRAAALDPTLVRHYGAEPGRHAHDHSQVLFGLDGSLKMELRVSHSPELEGSVLRWAGDVEVVTPGKLRERMRILGEKHAQVHR